MASLFVASLLFLGIHVGVSGTAVRDAMTVRLGMRGYLVLFSVASVASIAWLCAAYKTAPYVPSWGMLQGWKPVMIAGMLPAFVLVVMGLATPNPTAMAQERMASQPPRGIVRVTRHPFLMGVALWAALHAVGNGDLASLLFFGGLFAVCTLGAPSIDAKRRRTLGAEWEGFARQTSILPFAAAAAGRTRVEWRGLLGWPLGVGVLAWVLMLGGHAHLVGVSPWPGQ